jgi:gluconate 2-dehydrogenase subunit 3-like protein
MSNEAFSTDAKRVLASVLDEIIPPSADGRIPGAGEVGVADYLDRSLNAMPGLKSMVADGVLELDAQARARHGRSFPELSKPQKAQLLGEQGFVMPLTLHTYAGYYHADRVIEALGLEARAPHPRGYEMEPDDLSLLDPVRKRGKLYREV